MLDLSWAMVVLCTLIVFAGALVQASIGIGLGMMASPVLALADHDFIPGAIMIAVVPMSVAVAWADRSDIDARDVGLALGGRVPGVVLGAFVVAAVSDRMLGFLVGVSVLIAVVVSITARRFRPTQAALVAAGCGSGLAGTTTGVGGPPMALVYQHSDPAAMRASLSAFFAVGSVMSIFALSLAGEIGWRQIELTLFLLPSIAAGTVCARLLRHRLDPAVVRPVVLVVCTVAAFALLAESL